MAIQTVQYKQTDNSWGRENERVRGIGSDQRMRERESERASQDGKFQTK